MKIHKYVVVLTMELPEPMTKASVKRAVELMCRDMDIAPNAVTGDWVSARKVRVRSVDFD